MDHKCNCTIPDTAGDDLITVIWLGKKHSFKYGYFNDGSFLAHKTEKNDFCMPRSYIEKKYFQ